MEYHDIKFVYYDRMSDLILEMNIPIVNLPDNHFIFTMEEKIKRPIFEYHIDPYENEISITPNEKKKIWKIIEGILKKNRNIEACIAVHFRPCLKKIILLRKSLRIFGLSQQYI